MQNWWECLKKSKVLIYCCTAELTISEQAQTVLEREELASYTYKGVVVLHEAGVRSEPILVVGKYRVFFFKRPPAGARKVKLQLIKNFHLYDLWALHHCGSVKVEKFWFVCTYNFSENAHGHFQ